MDEQVIQLSLQTVGTEKADALAKSFSAIAAAGDFAATHVYEFADSYELLDTTIGEAAAAQDQFNRELDEFIARTMKAETAVRSTSAAVAKSEKEKRAYTTQVQAAAFALQDFVSVNGSLSQRFMAISNNLPMIIGGMGALGAVIGGVVAVGAVVGPHMFEYARSLVEVTTKVPEAADSLKRMTDRIKVNADELDNLQKKQNLTNSELARFNELTAENTRLEKEANEEKAKRARIDAALNGTSEEQQARAKAFGDAVQGQGGAFLEQIRRAVTADTERAIRDREKADAKGLDAFTGTDDQKLAEINRVMRAQDQFKGIARGDIDRRATDLFDRLLRGDANAGQALDALQVGGGGIGLANVNAQFKANQRAPFDAMVAKAQQDLDEAVAASIKDRQDAEKQRLDAEEADRKAAAGIRDAANADAAKKDAAAFGDQTDAAKAARKLRDQQVAELTARTPIDELATQYAAQAFAAGKRDIDPATGKPTGRIVPRELNPLTGRATNVDPFQAAVAHATRMVGRARPELSPDEARDAATQIVGQAFSQVEQAIQATRQGLSLSGRNLTVVQTTQQAVAAVLAAVQAQGGRLDQVEQVAQQLLGIAQDMNRGNNPRMRGQMRLRR
jgi:hypothetical protein